MLEWNDFILGDSFNLMQEIEPNSVDLIFTSVPDMNDLGIKAVSYTHLTLPTTPYV